MKLDPTEANAEYAGLTLFSRDGWKTMLEEAARRAENGAGPFHEASSFLKAGLSDLVQELIDKGREVHAVEVNSGWIELHSFEDYKHACRTV